MKGDWLLVVQNVALGLFCCFVVSFAVWAAFHLLSVKPEPEPKTYQIACMIWTPSGPIATIQTEAVNASITSFGVIKSDEGLYIPATNELCMVKEIK